MAMKRDVRLALKFRGRMARRCCSAWVVGPAVETGRRNPSPRRAAGR